MKEVYIPIAEDPIAPTGKLRATFRVGELRGQADGKLLVAIGNQVEAYSREEVYLEEEVWDQPVPVVLESDPLVGLDFRLAWYAVEARDELPPEEELGQALAEALEKLGGQVRDYPRLGKLVEKQSGQRYLPEAYEMGRAIIRKGGAPAYQAVRTAVGWSLSPYAGAEGLELDLEPLAERIFYLKSVSWGEAEGLAGRLLERHGLAAFLLGDEEVRLALEDETAPA